MNKIRRSQVLSDTLTQIITIGDMPLAGLYVAYQMFKEDDPNNLMDFMEISDKMVDKIMEKDRSCLK